MGLFSVRTRLPQPAGHNSSVRLHLTASLAQLTHQLGALRARLGLLAQAAIRRVGKELLAGSRQARLAAIAATNDARVVAVLLLLAALALGLEMAASFHVI